MNATIIEASSSTKTAPSTRNPEMHQTKNGNQYPFGIRAQFGVEMTVLVHTVVGTAANLRDVTQAHALQQGKEEMVLADSIRTTDGFSSLRRVSGAMFKTPCNALWQASSLGPRPAFVPVEHPFRVIKGQLGFTKVRNRGVAKNTVQLKMLFMLATLGKASHHVMG